MFDTGQTTEVEIPAEQIIHLRGIAAVPVNGHGSGVIDLHGAELGLAAAVRGYALGQFSSGVPAGYLKVNGPNPTQEQVDRAGSGSGWRSTAYRPSCSIRGAERDDRGLHPDLAVADRRPARPGAAVVAAGHRAGVRESRRRSWASRATRSTYSNVESRFIELRTYTLLNWIRRIEAATQRGVPAYGTDVKIVTAGLERGDTTSRYTDYKLALDAGFMTIDEVRELEDLPPLDAAGNGLEAVV